MVEIFGKSYYIDVENIVDKCTTYIPIKVNKEEDVDEDVEENIEDDEKLNIDTTTSIEVNIFKYEIIKMCLDRILNDFQDVDEEMGIFGQNNVNVSFKIAFNTLIKYNILIEDDE